jgi:hypothetical protein
MDQRGLGVYQSAAGPTGRCPVKPSTPLGPDQVNVIIIVIITNMWQGVEYLRPIFVTGLQS